MASKAIYTKNSFGKEAQALSDTIRSSNDRIAVIVAGAFFHDVLLEKIKVCLVEDEEVQDRLFHPSNGNIATYATLVDLGFLLGIIPRQAREWLKLVGHIRNHFAHKWGAESFLDLKTSDDKSIKADLKKLTHYIYPEGIQTDYTLRDHFDALTAGIIFALALGGPVNQHEELIEETLVGEISDVFPKFIKSELNKRIEKIDQQNR